VWIGIFKLNAQNIKSCILSKLLHRFKANFAQWQTDTTKLHFVVGPNTRIKIKNGHIYATVRPICTQFGSWRTFALQRVWTVKISNFWKSKMADCCHLKKSKTAISPKRLDRFAQNLAWWRIGPPKDLFRSYLTGRTQCVSASTGRPEPTWTHFRIWTNQARLL